MTTNKSQYTLTTQWIVPEEKKSEFESFFSEHEAWMRETHNLSGDSVSQGLLTILFQKHLSISTMI